jgi:hypothetical protein
VTILDRHLYVQLNLQTINYTKIRNIDTVLPQSRVENDKDKQLHDLVQKYSSRSTKTNSCNTLQVNTCGCCESRSNVHSAKLFFRSDVNIYHFYLFFVINVGTSLEEENSPRNIEFGV